MGDQDFKNYISQLQNLQKKQRYPSLNTLVYWKNITNDYYDLAAVENNCFALCNGIDVDMTSDFHYSTISVKLCKLCASNSNRYYEIKRRLLPHVLKSKFDGGLVDDYLILCEAEGTRNGNGDVLLKFKEVSRHMVYKHFSVIHQGILQIVFAETAKILSWDFCIQSAKIQQSPPYPMYVRWISAAEHRGAISTTAGTSDIKTIIDQYGLPRSYRRLIQIGDTLDAMSDIMDYSMQTGHPPILSMDLEPVSYQFDRSDIPRMLEFNPEDSEIQPSTSRTPAEPSTSRTPAEPREGDDE